MRYVIRAIAIVATAILVLGACNGNGDDTADDETPADEAPVDEREAGDAAEDAGAGGVAVETSETALGTVLVDGDGTTLYIFTEDEAGVSNCTGGCADTWPPVIVEEGFAAGQGLDASIFSTVERDDGSLQLAVNEMPLYRYAADNQAGDTNGQGVGDVWFVVSPEGEIVEDDAADAGDEGDGGGINY